MSTDIPEADRERQGADDDKKKGFWARLYHPNPAPEDFAQGRTIPLANAFFLSRLVFHWLTPLLKAGYSRPLEFGDLWVLDQGRLTTSNTDRLEREFYARCPPEKRPAFLRGETSSSEEITVEDQSKKNDLETTESATIDNKPTTSSDASSSKYDESLLLAANQVVFREFWTAGGLQLTADVVTACIPLLTRKILEFLTNSYYHVRLPAMFSYSPPLGEGLGWAFGIFGFQVISSLCANHSLRKSMTSGMVIRSAVTGMIFRKALRLSNRARVEHSPGKITTMISADAPRLEQAAQYGHFLWVGTIQLLLGLGLLISTLGYSALVGVAVIFFSFPLQGGMVYALFTQRTKATAIMDKRVRLLQEVLNGIRVIKVFAWENFFAEKISVFRRSELKHIRKLSIALSGLFSSVAVTPVIAAILSFIVYVLTGHSLNAPIIFASLQYFNIIRIPLILIPFVLGAVGDALVAVKRITPFLLAEELLEPYTIDPNSPWAVNAEGDFTWENLAVTEEAKKDAKKAEEKKEGKDKKTKAKNKKKAKDNDDGKKDDGKQEDKDEKTEEDPNPESDKPPFEMKNIQFRVPKGSFVAIVGKVGSGKSSLAQALIGEMRRTRGQTTFSGTVAYLPQTPWVMNATLRENILFGHDYDQERYQAVISACQLGPDIAILPHGDATEIGEKGISLSGGTKARVSLARAAYSNCDSVILDDTLSAVDAHVGKAILDECLLTGPLSTKTRILVTHALHVLPHVDAVFVVDEGKITEQGPYEELLSHGAAFSKLIEEFGNENRSQSIAEPVLKKPATTSSALKDAKDEKGIMQDEERNTGAVKTETYKKYLVSAGGISWAPLFLFLLIINEAANVSSNLFLGLWTSMKISGFENKDYMGVYAGLGVGNALTTFFAAYCFCIAGLRASYSLHASALQSVLRSPTSFFDTSPTGRITARFTRDTEVLDSELALGFFSLTLTFFSLFGIVFLVFYTFPYLGIIFVPLCILYYATALYYRRTSVETKRLDSLLRSKLFAVYSEALSGLSTLRASRREAAFMQNVEQALDHQNRAHIINVVLRSWLGVRLDAFGNLLVLGVSLFAVGLRRDVDPSKVGVVLSYSLAITWNFSELVNQYATLEQNMNCVERVMYYADELPSEMVKRNTSDSSDSPTVNPDPKWPAEGRIVFKDVKMRYREGLPMVLKGASFEVKAGEKVGVVGRTGAGKSSLLQIILRMIEVEEGAVEIDGVDVRDIDLETLRRNVAVIPQDVKLFQGTLRDNLDPLKTMTDAELIAALRLASLVSPEMPRVESEAQPLSGSSQIPSSEKLFIDKFTLDTEVENEGSNFSAGEGQLIALSRALAKGSKIVLLDEATSSVDVETDSRIQAILASSASTLVTIAHRLNTVAFYDRILVVDQGIVREFDEPLVLFDKGPWRAEKPDGSLFRNLCDEAGLTRDDIVKIRNRLRG